MVLSGKIALITGGMGAIGRAIVKLFLQEGAKVAINDINPVGVKSVVEKLRKTGGEVSEATADITKIEQCESAFQKVVDRHGRLDILVNSAGIRLDIPFTELSQSNWNEVIEVNLNGCFNCIKCVQQHMIKYGYGKIINIASDISDLFTLAQTPYIASGYGVQGLTKALALELGPYNINVNCVVPGFIDTEMTRKVAKMHDMYLDELQKMAISLVPLRKLGNSEDVANLCVFLASDNSSFITGQIIHIKGGP